MNRNVETTCGKVQVKGQPGLRGMAIGEIEKMIEGLVASNANLSSEFTRLKKGKVPKGESKRLRYCAFIKEKLGSEWNKYSKGKEEAKKTEPAPVPAAIRRMVAAAEGEEFAFNNNNEGELANIENNNGKEGGNYANENNRPMIFTGGFERGRRTVEKDPLKGVKISKPMLRRIQKQIKQMKEAGVNVPNFPNQNAMMRFVMLKKPTATAARKSRPAARKTPAKLMSFLEGGTARTARIEAGARVPIVSTGTMLSRAEIRTANALANRMIKAVNMGKNDPGFLKEILSSRYPNGDISTIMNRLKKEETLNYDSIRRVIRPFEMNRAKVLRDLGAPIARPEPAMVLGVPGGMSAPLPVAASGNRPMTMAEVMSDIRLKKASERTPTEKRLLKAAQAFARIRKERKLRKQRAAVPVTTVRPISLNSNKNSSNRSNSNNGSPVMKSPPGSNNSNSNSPPVPEKFVEAGKTLIEQRKEAAKEARRPALRPIPRSLTGIRVKNGAVSFRGENVNAMNKARMVNVAKRMYGYLKPKEAIPFENANNASLRRAIKAAAKKILVVK